LSGCASEPQPIPATAEILAQIPAVRNFNVGSDGDPCFDDINRDGKIDPVLEILPDPYNQCDTPETVDAILRTNAALDAAKRALGVPIY
jgi:hypothetical protein